VIQRLGKRSFCARDRAARWRWVARRSRQSRAWRSASPALAASWRCWCWYSDSSRSWSRWACLCSASARLQRRQLRPRLSEGVGAPGQFFGGAVAAAGLQSRAQLALQVGLLPGHRQHVGVELAQPALDRVAPCGQRRGAELVLGRIDPDAAPATSVAPVGLRCDPFAALAAAGLGVVDAADLGQLLEQPDRRGCGEAQHGQQAVAGRIAGGRRGVGDQVVAVALALGQRHGARLVGAAFEHHHPARSAQHAFGSAAPALVGDLDHIGQHMVGDVVLAQRAQKALHLGRRWGLALALQRLQRGLRGTVLGRQIVPAGVELGLAGLQLLYAFGQLRGIGFHRGQGLQLIGLLHQLFGGAFGVARLLLGALGAAARGFAVAHPVGGGALLLDQIEQLALDGRAALDFLRMVDALAVQLAQTGGGVEALFVPAQYRNHLGGQQLALAQLGLVLAVQVHACVELGQLGLSMAQLALGAGHFVGQFALVLARLLVAVQHLLVAEHIENQPQQLFGRVLAEPVGLALFQRQHARDRPRQTGTFQTLAPVLDAQPVLGRRIEQGFDRHIAIGHQVAALPVPAIALDAAGQRDLVGVQQVARERPARGLPAARPVLHGGTQPGGVGVGVACVGLVAAPARALQAEQGAHGIQQRGLARAVRPSHGDDGAVQRQRQALAVVPLQQFQALQVEHQAGPSGDAAGSVAVAVAAAWARVRASTSPSAPSRMRGASRS
jgi:hypothetical protein